MRKRHKAGSQGPADQPVVNDEASTGSPGQFEFQCKKCGTENRVKAGSATAKGLKKPSRGRVSRVGRWLILFFAAVGASDYFRRAGLGDMLQQQLKTRLNVTLPEWELPEALQYIPFLSGNHTERLGVRLYKEGLRPKYPIVIVPGFVTTGLELWAAKPCAESSFRQRVWGTMNMPQAILSNARCWLEHMGLHQKTGLDPAGIKLRASEGLAAVDFLMPGYFVWGKIIEALADIGYDCNNVVGETYDWRLSIANMERRDGYFSRLKTRVESLKQLHGEKVLITSHSWGENVVRNFLWWVERKEEGWTEANVANYVSIAGTVLGVPKAVAALLSGEMRDTAELGAMTKHAAENYLPQPSRAHMFRSWGSVIGMLPAGGNRVWGNLTWAPDDTRPLDIANVTYGAFLTKMEVHGGSQPGLWERANRLLGTTPPSKRSDGLEEEVSGGDPNSEYPTSPDWEGMTLDEAIGLLLEEGAFGSSPHLAQHIGKWAVVSGTNGKRHGDGYDKDADVYMHDPMEDPMPFAPSLKMFCVYGVDKPVERSYLYIKQMDEEKVTKSNKGDLAEREQGVPLQWAIATKVSNSTTLLDSGVRKGNGDGTVPLISLGVHCRKGWLGKTKLNPSGFSIKTKELQHDPVPIYQDPRGGGRSADHVDVLGNVGLMDLLLRVAAGREDEVEDLIISNIDEIAEQIDFEGEPPAQSPLTKLAEQLQHIIET